MNILYAIIIGVIASLVASFIFLRFMLFLKPRIVVSPYIAKEEKYGKVYYWFKVVNLTHRDLINLKAELGLTRSTHVEGGPVFFFKSIPLRNDQALFLSGYNKNDKDANYALRFSTVEDLDDLWQSDNEFLEFTIFANDSLSGFGNAVRKKFNLKRASIIKGSHKFGKDLTVS